ncbi:MAG: ABC transporter substrate-binding protein [Patescibacteria group bacterium]|jgi:NitT/TauT family transport system substrate-binding protein
MKKCLIASLLVGVISLTGCGNSTATSEKPTIKVGYFPNITHAQALVGLADGTFQKTLGDNVIIETKTFNAGPEEIEALLAGAIDIGYIGPSPAVNGYIKSNGEALKIISGSASGGAALVVQPELAEAFVKNGVQALAGKKIASPQQGNTQDVALRYYLKQNGLDQSTQVIPIANADQLTMFSQKELDGAWAPEPWAARLIQEASGQLIIDERDLWPDKQFTTTNVIVSTKFLNEQPDLVKQWLTAHVAVTDWINNHPTEAQTTVNNEIEKLTTKKLKDSVLAEAWQRLNITVNPYQASVITMAQHAYDQGYLGEQQPVLDSLYDLTTLNEITGQQY